MWSCGSFSYAGALIGKALGIAEAAPGGATSAANKAAAAVNTVLAVNTNDIPGTIEITAGNLILVSLASQIGTLNGQKKATDTTNTFWGCLARTVARIALNEITNSVVNWINSGFGADGGPGSGGPGFVTNPERFFTQLADKTAGSLLKAAHYRFYVAHSSCKYA